jgi:hypothetical protein
VHAHGVQARGAPREHLDQPRLVERRIGVGRAGERGHPARDRRAHLAFERGLVLEAGLAQARREVDQPRRGDEALRVDHLVGTEAVGRLVERGDLPVGNVDRSRLVAAGRRIDDARIGDPDPGSRLPAPLHAEPSSDITAMRTAIPKVTCGRMTLCLPSATGESISTPRFMGPGCITIASGLARASLSAVSP